jgi:hypothetical protein
LLEKDFDAVVLTSAIVCRLPLAISNKNISTGANRKLNEPKVFALSGFV